MSPWFEINIDQWHFGQVTLFIMSLQETERQMKMKLPVKPGACEIVQNVSALYFLICINICIISWKTNKILMLKKKPKCPLMYYTGQTEIGMHFQTWLYCISISTGGREEPPHPRKEKLKLPHFSYQSRPSWAFLAISAVKWGQERSSGSSWVKWLQVKFCNRCWQGYIQFQEMTQTGRTYTPSRCLTLEGEVMQIRQGHVIYTDIQGDIARKIGRLVYGSNVRFQDPTRQTKTKYFGIIKNFK